MSHAFSFQTSQNGQFQGWEFVLCFDVNIMDFREAFGCCWVVKYLNMPLQASKAALDRVVRSSDQLFPHPQGLRQLLLFLRVEVPLLCSFLPI